MASTPRDDATQPRKGRRVGENQTRQHILVIAREQFARKGYAGTSVRAIAAAAGVDPALVRHFYGSKDDLFASTLEFPPEMVQAMLQTLSGDPATLGERIVGTYLAFCEDPATAEPLFTIVRSAVTMPAAADRLRVIFGAQILREAAAALGGPDPEARAGMAGAHLLGIAMARYIFGVEPLASMDLDQVVDMCAPAIQRYLAGT